MICSERAHCEYSHCLTVAAVAFDCVRLVVVGCLYLNILACTRPPSGLVLGCQIFRLLLPDTCKVALSHEHGCTNSQVLLTCLKCVNTMHCQITKNALSLAGGYGWAGFQLD